VSDFSPNLLPLLTNMSSMRGHCSLMEICTSSSKELAKARSTLNYAYQVRTEVAVALASKRKPKLNPQVP
jgi:hypothetical protein